jgi:hypothetical protein
MPEQTRTPHTSAIIGTCPTCIDLEAAGSSQKEGAGAALAKLIEHHIDVHQAAGVRISACRRCAEYRRTQGHGSLLAHWARVHFVMHQLGITEERPYPRSRHDDPLYPLRFTDQLTSAPGQ